MTELRQKYDALVARYQQLADDHDVKAALDEYNLGSSTVCKLGPLKSTTDTIKKITGGVITDSVPIHRVAGGNWHIFATINDHQPPIEFMLDTGASDISLPYKAAVAAGIIPTKKLRSPTTKSPMANRSRRT